MLTLLVRIPKHYRKVETRRENWYPLKEYLTCHEWTAGRNTAIKVLPVKAQEELIGNWRKEYPYITAENFTAFQSAGVTNDKFAYLAGDISQQGCEGMAWLLIAAYCKM